ncbi:hypothetical protein [Hymenobacter lapidiphilus]|uniref:hypothetical protein n=1 Tax=Hymenobacter sp. CCM 8763 TaxID=2303334 RepID=UPI000E3499A9|nr:hypothetical protein [Hymenobacter sp. CCM 8763]
MLPSFLCWRRSAVGLLALPLLLSGCVSTKSTYTRDQVARRLKARSGYELGAARTASAPAPALPNLQDGLSEDETVNLALTRNPAFQADLSTLALAQADLRDAGLLANPVLSGVTAYGTSPVFLALNFASDLLWHARAGWAPPSSKPSAWPKAW